MRRPAWRPATGTRSSSPWNMAAKSGSDGLEADRGEAVAGGAELGPELGVGEAGGDRRARPPRPGGGRRPRAARRSNSASPGGVTVGRRLGPRSSSSMPGPARARSSASSSASLEPTAMRPSSSASARPGMTLTLLAGVDHRRAGRVAQHRAEQAGHPRVADARGAGPGSDQRGWSSSGRAARPARPWSSARASRNRRTSGEACSGSRRRPTRARNSDSRTTALSSRGMLPCPVAPEADGPQPGDALLGHLDRVEGPPAQVEGGPADLPEGVAGPDLVRVVVDQPGAAGRRSRPPRRPPRPA